MINVAYVECTGELWPRIAATLEREDGWRPVYWSGAAGFRDLVEATFPQIAFQENTSAVKGQLPGWLSEAELPAVDEDVLSSLSRVEPIAVRMMDRMDPDGSFDYVARTRLFRRHVAIGLAVIDKLALRRVVFSSAPHLVYDYTLYMLCQLKGIETAVFVETAVDGLVFAATRFEEAGDTVGRAYRELLARGAEPELSPSAAGYLSRMRTDYGQAVPNYILELQKYQPTGPAANRSRDEIDRSMRRLAQRMFPHQIVPTELPRDAPPARALWSRGLKAVNARVQHVVRAAKKRVAPAQASELPLEALADMLSGSGRGSPDAMADALDCTRHIYQAVEAEYPLLFRSTDPAPVTYLKQFGVEPWESELGYIEYWLYRMLGLRKKRLLAERYEQVASSIDVGQPYIYVPLQYQPEVSTQPLAGYYADQELMVEVLCKTAPKDWLVLVKEHPFTFDKKGSGELSRGIDFYDRIVRFPNVRIAPVKTPPFVLIDRARAVATATGTSGWQAVCRGVPALLFGHSWYLRCEGAFDVRNADDCRAALERIAAGYTLDEARVSFFFQAIETIGFRGYTIPDLAADARVEDAVNHTGFVSALRRRFANGERAHARGDALTRVQTPG